MFRWRESVALAGLAILMGCAAPHHPEYARTAPIHTPTSQRPASPPPAVPAPVRPPVAASPVADPAPVPSTQAGWTHGQSGPWVPLRRYAQSSHWPQPHLVQARPAPVYEVTSPKGSFVFRIGTVSATWDGLEIQLGNPPQMMAGEPHLHSLDLVKTVDPLMRGLPQTNLTQPSIVIDAGHGGPDQGTRCVLGGQSEKDYTLDWALRLRDLLTEAGWKVAMTRTNDVEISIADRVAFAEAQRADLFVSLHFNSAAPNQTLSGLETYGLTPSGLPSNLTRGYEDDVNALFPNNAFDAQNLRLGVQVHRAMVRANGSQDRGFRRARFLGVLRGQNRPAILVEGGYLSNPAEARQIADPDHRQKMARAVADALIRGWQRPAAAVSASNL